MIWLVWHVWGVGLAELVWTDVAAVPATWLIPCFWSWAYYSTMAAMGWNKTRQKKTGLWSRLGWQNCRSEPRSDKAIEIELVVI